MGKQLTPRQMQAIAKPCPTVAHAHSPSLIRKIGDYSTLLYVGPMGDRIRWCASVARQQDGHAIELAVMSHKQRKEMETLAREMLYLAQPKGASVGKGNHTLAPGLYAVNLYRELTDDEIQLLPADWQTQPTDEQILRRQA